MKRRIFRGSFISVGFCFFKSSEFSLTIFRGKRFSLPYLPDSSGAHPASYLMGMGGKVGGA
jgi:hypothetical protein